MSTELKPGETDKLWDDLQHHHARAHLPRPGVRRRAYHSLADLVQYYRRFIDHKKPDCEPSFILISCTDWLDGYLARSRGEVTKSR